MRALAASLCAVVLVVGGDRASAASLSAPPVKVALKVAVLPIENLTGAAAPVRELSTKLASVLARQTGLELVSGEALQAFLVERRLRQTSAVDRDSAKAAAELLGVDAILITTLENWREADPPKLGLSMRLVRAADDPSILWADGASTAGDEKPGVLGLGLIEAMPELEDLLLGRLARSLDAFAAGREPLPAEACSPSLWFGPKVHFRSPLLDAPEPYTVAVVPFLNATRQRRGGELLASQFVRQLATSGPFRVLEPGVVRDILLKYRVVIPGGVDLETTRELLGALEADLVLSGTLLEYEDLGNLEGPRVRFSTTLFDAHTGKVLWQSTSYNRGNDGVIVFDLGQVRTSTGMACRMVTGVVEGLAPRASPHGGVRERWSLPRPARAGLSPGTAHCQAPLPVGALGVAPAEVEPAFIDRRPGKVGEALQALRAIEVRFDAKSGAMLPPDQEALALLARCALTQGHDLVVRARVAPTPEQLVDAARRTVDALRAVDKLQRDRVRLEIRSEGEGGDQLEVLVAVVPGSGSGPLPATVAPVTVAATLEAPPPPPPESKAQVGVEAAARSERLRAANARFQDTEKGLSKRSSELAARAQEVDRRAQKLESAERALGGAGGTLPAVGPQERALVQLEDRQRAVEKRLRAVQVTLLANEARRRQDEAAALAEAARVRREQPDGAARQASEDAVLRARERRQEAATDSLAVQEKLLAAIEARLDAQAQRLEAVEARQP